MKWFLTFIVVTGCVSLAMYIGYQAGYHNGRLDTLPTQSEVQEALGVEVDGIIGRESRRVWDATIERRVCDEAAMPIMTAFNRDFDRICLNGMEFD